MKKVLTIRWWHHGDNSYYTGTLEELCSDTFSYKLEQGHKLNPKIDLYPKTGEDLVKTLNQIEQETRSNPYDRYIYKFMNW